MAKFTLVSGAAGVLGQAVVTALADAGWTVAALDVSAAPVSGAALSVTSVDLADGQAVAEAVASVKETFGRLDGLVNVAGGFRWEALADGSVDTWDLMYQINLRTAVQLSKACLPLLGEQGGGAIVNIGAGAAVKATTGMGAYAASKSGVARLTEALADELKDQNIRVNAVLPSIIDTPANRNNMPDADFAKWVSPAALASVVAFLLSDDAQAITGALLPVTGRL
ncbi:MAG: SDR family oxidoreductase [Sphingorhabdus sp.]